MSRPTKPDETPTALRAKLATLLGMKLVIRPDEGLSDFIQNVFFCYYLQWLKTAIEVSQGQGLTEAPLPTITVDDHTGGVTITFMVAEVPDAAEFYREKLAAYLEEREKALQ